MNVKPYRKDSFYSYTLGAFPTIELLKHHASSVLKIYLHTSFKNQEVIAMINKLRGKCEMSYNDKIIEKLSSKENCYVVAIFQKYSMTLDLKQDHILLDNPSNMGNLGTIIRSAIGFNFHNIAIIKPGVDIFDPKVIRASMGAFFACNIVFFNSYEDYQKEYSQHATYAFMLQAKKQLQNVEFPFDHPITLIFGNEATGLSSNYLNRNSLIIRHSSEIDSLNLPNAVTIALYEVAKQKNRQ